MDTEVHPLRRRYFLELVLGGLVAFAAIVVLVERRTETPGAREGARAAVEPTRTGPELAPVPGAVAERSAVEQGARPAERAGLAALQVRVVDRNGAPLAGVPVEWHAWAVENPRAILEGGSGRTRPEDGVAELSLAIFHERLRRRQQAGVSLRYRASVALPFVGGAPAADLGDDPSRQALVTLVLPDTGSLEARVTLADGTSVDSGARVQAWGWPPADANDDEFLGEAPVVGGRATLEHVGLGLVLRLSASPENHAQAADWREIRGPTRPGERVEVQLRLGPEATRVGFRAVDELGAPLGEARLAGTITVGLPDQEYTLEFRFDAQTAADGQTLFRLDGLPENPRPGSLRIDTQFTSESKAIHRLRAEVAVPALQLERENDLGTIVLHGPPPSDPGVVLVSGSVLDDPTGAPLAKARVVLSEGRPGGEQTWIQNAIAGIDGHFEIRGPPGLEDLRLQVFATEHERVESAVEPGASLVLRLERQTSMVVSFLLEPEFPLHRLRFILVSEDESEYVGELFELDRVRFRGAPPGMYTFEVSTQDVPSLIERIDGIRLGDPRAPFGTPTDPRLDPLDLRGKIVLAPLVLQGTDGQPIAGEIVRVLLDSVESGRVVSGPKGRLVLVVPARALVELEPEGFQPLACAVSREEQVLVFSPR